MRSTSEKSTNAMGERRAQDKTERKKKTTRSHLTQPPQKAILDGISTHTSMDIDDDSTHTSMDIDDGNGGTCSGTHSTSHASHRGGAFRHSRPRPAKSGLFIFSKRVSRPLSPSLCVFMDTASYPPSPSHKTHPECGYRWCLCTRAGTKQTRKLSRPCSTPKWPCKRSLKWVTR
jgi:hypothetical protein